MLGIAAIFGAAIGQHAAKLHVVGVIERRDAIIDEIGGGDRRLAIVEFGESDLGVSVDKGLLVDASDALHIADIEGVLGAAIARTFALELAVRLLFSLGLLQGGELAFGEDEAVLG